MKYSKENLEKAVQNNTSFVGVLKYFGFDKCAGGTYGWIRAKIKEFEIDTTHFKRSPQLGRLRVNRRSAEQILIKRTSGPRTETHVLKRAMIEAGVQYECEECGVGPIWEGLPLKIQIDHKDGDWRNDSRDNVRFLCPNCHSQTPTHSVVKNKLALSTSKRERPFSGPCNPTKIIWPSEHELLELVKILPLRTIAKKLGVSDKSVKKYCKKFNIQTYPSGYWTNKPRFD